MKAHFTTNNITKRRDANRAQWDAVMAHAKKIEHGFPQSGLDLVGKNTDAGRQAKEHLNHLVLDCLKKGRETETKEDLAKASRKRRAAAADLDEEEEDDISQPAAATVVRVYIADPDAPACRIVPAVTDPALAYKWATCPKSQLVRLKEISLAELYKGVKSRLGDDKIRAVYGALEKPAADGSVPTDVERLHTDEDLLNFFDVVKNIYTPICLQVQIFSRVGAAATPEPDDRPYYDEDKFDEVPIAAADVYDPAASDSDDEEYLIAKGRRRKRAWPKTDVGFETQKAKLRKRIKRLKTKLTDMKNRHATFMDNSGLDSTDILDSDDDNEWPFYFADYLNPQSGADWVDCRTAATDGADAYALTAGTRAQKIAAGEAAAVASWGKGPLVGNFNSD